MRDGALRAMVTGAVLWSGVALADAAQDRIHAEMVEALKAYAVAKMGLHEEGFAAWMALAEKGNAQGILNVAAMLMEGRGTARDPAAAVDWLRRGAMQGDPLSLHGLAQAHRDGAGVAADPAEADRLLRLAAEAGAVAAQREHGLTLAAAGDAAGAARWLRRAADGGDPEARAALAAMPGAAPAGDLDPRDRRRIAELLAELDAAANARDAQALVAPIGPDAPILVRLPGDAAARAYDRAAYEALWAETFAAADRYRFIRAFHDAVAMPGGAVVTSSIRETLGRAGEPRLLSVTERLEIALDGPAPAIRAVALDATADD